VRRIVAAPETARLEAVTLGVSEESGNGFSLATSFPRKRESRTSDVF